MALSGNIKAGRAYVELVSDSNKLTRGLREAQAKLRAFGNAAQSIGREMLTLSSMMALPFAYSAKSFAAFDDAMRLAQAITQATGEEFDALTKTAQRLGRETSFTAQQVANAMVSLGRMGFAPKEIQAAIADVLNLARATGTDLAEAADFAANSMRIFGLESAEMTRVADTLTVTANGSAQTLVDLFEALKIAGPQARAAGENIEQTNAALGVLANMGIKGSLAGTALRKSFSQFARLDVQNTLAQWGIATTTTTGNLRPLADVMVEIARVMKQMPTAQRLTFAEEIFDLRGSLAGLSITADVKALEDFTKKLQNIGGVAAETATKMDAGLGGSFRLLASAAEGSINEIGATLARTLQPMISNLITTINAFTAWIQQNGKLVTAITATVATMLAFGAALLTLGTAVKITAGGLGALRVIISQLDGLWSVLKASTVGLSRSIGLVANAFANYNNLAQPAIVSTSRLLAALNLPIDKRANQIASSLVLMSNAETAATTKSMIAAKWQALTAVFSKSNATLLASTIATKAHTVATIASATAAKTLAFVRALAATATGKLTLATLLATTATTANTAANAALAISTKTVAAGYLALNAAMRAFCAIPISVVVLAIVASLALLYRALAKSGDYTAKIVDNMQKLRAETDALRSADTLRMQRLQQLNQKQKLSNEEIAEAEKLAKTLNERYGNLGLAIDRMSSRLTIAADAQSKLSQAMRQAQIASIKAEYAEAAQNLEELRKEQQALQHWSNYNLLSKMTGRYDQTLQEIPLLDSKIAAAQNKLLALEAQIDILQSGDNLPGDETNEVESLQAKIEQEKIQKIASIDEITAAEKRLAEIERQVRRDQQTALENEIEDIRTLQAEYIDLQQKMVAYYTAQKNNTAAAQAEEKIAQAIKLQDQLIAKAKEAAAEQDAELSNAAKAQLAQDLAMADRAQNERQFDAGLAQLQQSNPTAANNLLTNIVAKLEAALQKARADYENEVASATADNKLTADESTQIAIAAERFQTASSLYEKYAGQLASARSETNRAITDDQTRTMGTFFARAVRGLGVMSSADKQAKAQEDTAKNTKRTVQILENIANQGIAFA